MLLFVSGNDSERAAPHCGMVYPVSFTFLHTTTASVQMDRVYYVVLQATNGAGLRTTTLSKPIVLDTADPYGGVVVDGHDFKKDLSYQGQNIEMRGKLFGYFPMI